MRSLCSNCLFLCAPWSSLLLTSDNCTCGRLPNVVKLGAFRHSVNYISTEMNILTYTHCISSYSLSAVYCGLLDACPFSFLFSPLISAICQHFNPLFYYHHPSSSFSPFFYLVNPVGLFSCAPFFFLSYHQPLFLFSSLSIFLAFYLPDVRQEKETGSASVIGQRRQRPQPRLTSWVDVTNMI